jgi:septum formation protein
VPLILASGSPQRRAILAQLGIEFTVDQPDADELEEGPPHEVAIENAHRKATVVAARHLDALVLGVDTVVAVGARIYGKPSDRAAAGETLRALRGRSHVVVSGVCLTQAGTSRTAAVTTTVAFRSFDESTLEWYLESGEWHGRAGGYAIQGRGAALVASIDGDYSNVVGLPVATLVELVPGLLRDRRPNVAGDDRAR